MMGGSEFQTEEPEKSKLIYQYGGMVKHSFLIHTEQMLVREGWTNMEVPCLLNVSTLKLPL